MKRAHRQREWPCFIFSPLIMLLWRRIFTIRAWRIGRRLSLALRCRSEKRIKKTILETLEESMACAIQRSKHGPELTYLLFVTQTSAYGTHCTDNFQYFQYSNPFLPGSFRSTPFSSSWWAPFHNIFGNLPYSILWTCPYHFSCWVVEDWWEKRD